MILSLQKSEPVSWTFIRKTFSVQTAAFQHAHIESERSHVWNIHRRLVCAASFESDASITQLLETLFVFFLLVYIKQVHRFNYLTLLQWK